MPRQLFWFVHLASVPWLNQGFCRLPGVVRPGNHYRRLFRRDTVLHRFWLKPLMVVVLAVSIVRAEKLTIAVNTFQPQGVEESSVMIITDRVCAELFRASLFTVVERGEMEAVLKEQGFQQTGCISDACAVEMGQLLGVQYIITGSIGRIGKTHTISMRMIDVATGKIAAVASTDCKCEIDDFLVDATPKAVRALVVEVRKSIMEESEETPSLAFGALKIRTDPPGA
ncbi:MAG: hypothetical protein GF418_08840, partial [Chitinivibrionales bacterium]|nr:hypothetical protein [Chitinivibrionales bacterium]